LPSFSSLVLASVVQGDAVNCNNMLTLIWPEHLLADTVSFTETIELVAKRCDIDFLSQNQDTMKRATPPLVQALAYDISRQDQLLHDIDDIVMCNVYCANRGNCRSSTQVHDFNSWQTQSHRQQQ